MKKLLVLLLFSTLAKADLNLSEQEINQIKEGLKTRQYQFEASLHDCLTLQEHMFPVLKKEDIEIIGNACAEIALHAYVRIILAADQIEKEKKATLEQVLSEPNSTENENSEKEEATYDSEGNLRSFEK